MNIPDEGYSINCVVCVHLDVYVLLISLCGYICCWTISSWASSV